MALPHLYNSVMRPSPALKMCTYLSKTGLTGAPNLYTVASDSMNEKKPDMNIVVAKRLN